MTIKKDSIDIVAKKLNGYAVLQKNINYITNKIKMIDHELTKVKIVQFRETRGQATQDRIERLLDEKIKLDDKLNELKLEAQFIAAAINTLDDIKRGVITDFYFKKYSVAKISTNKNYSERYIRKIRNNALLELIMYLN